MDGEHDPLGKARIACTGVIGKPDELDARTTSAGNIASSRETGFL
jgi:hypothetical protein